MKVILVKDVKGLGEKESLVNVSDGYARNYLIPKGLACLSNPKNLNVMKAKNKAMEAKKEKEIEEAKSLADKLNQSSITIKAKAGENGKLFGSITSKDISEKIKSMHNLDIDKRKIVLDEPLKSMGEFNIEIKIYPEISAELKVYIENE